MPNSPGPYFVEINYHGNRAPHTMTLPIKGWNGESSPGGAGTITNWVDGDIDAVDMITDLVDVILPFVNSDTVFDNFVIFHKPVDPGPATPVAAKAFTAKVGTNIDPSWASAVQLSIIARTGGFGTAKIVILDAVGGDDFNRVITPTTEITNLMNVWGDLDNGWAGRDNTKPETFIKATKTLNEKLRKNYGYT